MKEDLHKTRWSRLSIRLHVPQTMGVFILAAGDGNGSESVLLVGSARNLRARLLQLFDLAELKDLSARAVHWVADLTVEQARLAERQFIRRYDPPLNHAPRSRYLDILAG
ncbi:MAG TPA: GIY-YIG nuclease family protein [Gemmatimonadota bacterium]|nr:GIY-YIG nuclease family protein [Gemmatimonadota bacterium]